MTAPLWSSTAMVTEANYERLAHMEWCQVWEPGIGGGVATQAQRQQLLWGYPGIAWESSVTASIVGAFSETEIVAGGQTIIITLSGDTWVAAGATFNAQRQNIIDGLTSAQSETLGWNNEVRDKEVVGAVVRTSDTVVTITLTASPLYDITAQEIVTVTIPATALVGGDQIVGAQAVTVDPFVLAKKGGHTRKRGPKRYLVEIDKQIFFVNTIAEAEALLATVRDLADESAERDVKTPVTPKPPRIKIRTGSGKKTTSPTLQRAVQRTQKTVRQAYSQRANAIAQDLEIQRLLHRKLEQEQADDEDTVIRLLLM